MTYIDNDSISRAIDARYHVNTWTADSLADVVNHGYNAESLKTIEDANAALVAACLNGKDDIERADIQPCINNVTGNHVDWLAYLDIAFALAHANPQAMAQVDLSELKKLAEPVPSLPTVEPVQTARQRLLGFPKPVVTQPKQDPRQVSVASFFQALEL
jgi:hypothetical protein